MKKISILLAIIISFTMITTACNKVENSKSDKSSSSSQDKDSSKSDSKKSNDSKKSDDSNKDSSSSTTSKSGSDKNNSAQTTAAVTQMAETSKVRYGFNTLSDSEKDIYSKILDAANNFRSTVNFDTAISYDTLHKIFGLVYFQEPQIFWLSGSYEVFDGTVNSSNLYYKYNQEQVKTMQAEIDAKYKELTGSFPANATVVDKLKVFHDYIAKHSTFKALDGTEATYDVQTIYGALISGNTQCEGYAKAMGYLCDKSGIENMLIVGTNNKQASHAWNLVKIDGEWYNLDITWDDPANKTDPNYVRYNYFNVTDAEILNKTHFQDLSYFTPPKATATKANYQINYGLYAKSYDEAIKMIKDQLTKASSEKRCEIQVKVSSQAVLDELNKKLVEQTGIFAILKDANNTVKNKFKTDTVTPAKDDNVLTMQLVVEYQ